MGKALITGASSGIGKVYAEKLARRGYDLVLVARDTARLETVAQSLSRETGVTAEVLTADLSRADDVTRVERKLESDPALDFFVNNAGIATMGPQLETPVAAIEKLIAVNVTAATRLALAAGRAFAARGHGSIVNMASVVAVNPERFNAVYSGSKGFVLTLTRALKRELDEKGVTIQAVLPGITKTEIWERSGRDPSTLNPDFAMETDEMVDAALAGLDQGELVTIPSLPDAQDLADYEAARRKLFPNLSWKHAAARYGVPRKP
jgi:short-subunit dehydrogenase